MAKKDGMKYEAYPTELKDIPVGQRFLMLNYKPLFMRIELGHELQHTRKITESNFVPILNLERGTVSLMANEKPCRVWGG